MVAGAFAQFGIQIPSVFRYAKHLRFAIDMTFAPVREVIRNFTPVVVGRGVVQLSGYIDNLLATLLGAAAHVFGLNPVKALIWAAVLNGIVAVPVMALLMLLSTSRAIMGEFRISRRWAVIGWGATAVMGVASTAFVLAMVRPAG